ncbi:MAG: hypothetical protein ACOYO9_08490 [Candidatus Nanopelagicales bacterium]|jgi:muconolactone delta-isomerase
MDSFMVVCTFAPGTDMGEVMAVVAEEQAKVAELKELGSIGAVYLSTRERGTVFLEIFADSADGAREAVVSLPMSKWWDLDIFPINAPVARDLAASQS